MYIKIGIIFVFAIYLVSCFVIGYKNTMRREQNCTETVIAKISNVISHKFFGCEYFAATLSYNYNGKDYEIRKGLFTKKT